MTEEAGGSAHEVWGENLHSEEDSIDMFIASDSEHRAKQRSAYGSWNSPSASLWKRLVAALVRAGGIRLGRFPE